MRFFHCLFLLLAVSGLLFAQQKKTPAMSSAAASGATVFAKLCEDPYQINEPADGWPEGPVAILFHREKSKVWSHNPLIKLPGLEAALPAKAKTLVCVDETLSEEGKYESGEPGYEADWSVTLVRPSDRKRYFVESRFHGEKPPGVKYGRGGGIGKRPVEAFSQWLRLVVDQKVARFKMSLRSKEYEEVSALAFSTDNTRLVVAQEGRSTLNGTPPSPITVFDLASGKPLTSFFPNVQAYRVAISKASTLVAADTYRHVEIWDVATGKVVHRLSAPEHVSSLAFTADDSLAVAGDNDATLWDVAQERKLRTAAGSYMVQSPAGGWLIAKTGKKDVTVTNLDSGQIVATYPAVGSQNKFAITPDGKALSEYSVLYTSMYIAGDPQPKQVSLPANGVGLMYAAAPTRDGFVFANGDGFAGLVSSSNPQVRAFATAHRAIKAVGVSPDGKLIAFGDSSGNVSVWELL
jgi:WD40 repeat protein